MDQMEQFCFLLLYLTQVKEVTTNNTSFASVFSFFFKQQQQQKTHKQTKNTKRRKKDPTSPYLLRIRLVWHFPPTLPFQISVTHICFFLELWCKSFLTS